MACLDLSRVRCIGLPASGALEPLLQGLVAILHMSLEVTYRSYDYYYGEIR